MKTIKFKTITVPEEQIINAASKGYLMIGGLLKQTIGKNLSLEVITEKKCIIVMDNVTYNETYVKDLFQTLYNKTLITVDDSEGTDENRMLARRLIDMFEKTEFYYIDQALLRLQIISPHQVDLANEKGYGYKEIEKMITPCIMSLNIEGNDIGIYKEKIAPLDELSVEDIMNYLYR